MLASLLERQSVETADDSEELELCMRICGTLVEASRTHPPLQALIRARLLRRLQDRVRDGRPAVAAQAAELTASVLTLVGVDPSEAERGVAELQEAVADAGSPEPPLIAAGLDAIRKALLRRCPCALDKLELLCQVARLRLAHRDSFVYQAALNTLAAAAEVAPRTVMPRLAELVLPPRSYLNSGSAEVVERRLKGAQVLCQAVARLGDALPPHADAAVGALMQGARDEDAAVRASCLAALATVAATLRLALHPWAVEILALATGALKREQMSRLTLAVDDEEAAAVRDECRAAALLVGLLLQRLGADAVPLLSGRQLRDLLVCLRAARDSAADAVLREHAAAAVEQLDALARSVLRGANANNGLSVRMP